MIILIDAFIMGIRIDNKKISIKIPIIPPENQPM